MSGAQVPAQQVWNDKLNVQQTDSEYLVTRCSVEETELAYSIVSEYYDAVDVLVRDNKNDFLQYFQDGSGIWIARTNEDVIGCIALRPLTEIASACEVKRLYVKPQWRGRGIAERLLNALHDYANSCHYKWCYLDSKDDLVAAIKFYERHGYAHCDKYNNNPQATIFMRKQLSETATKEF